MATSQTGSTADVDACSNNEPIARNARTQISHSLDTSVTFPLHVLTTGAYGGSNSDFSNELTLYVHVNDIFTFCFLSTSHRHLQCWLLKVTEFAIRDSISTVFSHIEV